MPMTRRNIRRFSFKNVCFCPSLRCLCWPCERLPSADGDPAKASLQIASSPHFCAGAMTAWPALRHPKIRIDACCEAMGFSSRTATPDDGFGLPPHYGQQQHPAPCRAMDVPEWASQLRLACFNDVETVIENSTGFSV